MLNRWKFTGGKPETPCGAGSTLATTAYLRERLPGVLSSLSIMTLLDAPCGDLNWMQEVDLSGVDYIGCDIDHLATARWNAATGFNAHSFRFLEVDIVNGLLPRADAILCRDFMQHLPNEMVFQTLRNFKRTGAEWLLMTSHLNETNADILTAGEFRPLNLQELPFNLPEPAMSIGDPPGSSRILGVWSAATLS